MNGVNVRVVGTKIVVETEIPQAIAGGVGDIKPDHEVDYLAMAVSLSHQRVASRCYRWCPDWCGKENWRILPES